MATRAPPTTRWKPWCAPPLPGADGARVLTEELLSAALQRKFLLYDKSGEEHYNLISALHKSVRNSDADATLYWLARMLESGEDPLYVARRLVRMASEDIGLADPAALGLPSPPCRPPILSACRKAIWLWRKPPSIWRWRPNRMRSTPATAKRRRIYRRPRPNRCRCICATPSPA